MEREGLPSRRPLPRLAHSFPNLSAPARAPDRDCTHGGVRTAFTVGPRVNLIDKAPWEGFCDSAIYHGRAQSERYTVSGEMRSTTFPVFWPLST
jgi:hypothetical protein